MKVVAIVQARMGSSRLPGKVMKLINGIPIIELLLLRLSKSKLIDEIVVATSHSNKDIPLIEHIKTLGFTSFQGSENDVLKRFFNAAKYYDADVVVRITGDCPFVDANLVDQVIQGYLNSEFDYFSNVMPPTFPDGLDVEVLSYSTLEKSHIDCQELHEREHVTKYARESGIFQVGNFTSNEDFSHVRLTLDELDDFILVDKIFNHFWPNIYFSWSDIINLQKCSPDIFEINQNINRNEGSYMGAGQKLYKRAKNLIPGGTMLLSKRPEMFLPDLWPSYFSKSKGCHIWDLDDNKYLDMSIMGIGTNTLGYGNDEVDKAVKENIDRGNMSTFNCPEEVELAEKLIEINPWADMVRFARSGGEANAIAVRIARACSGKDKVAICGYHGWHDWYLATNIESSDGLDSHLLPGLESNGVPKNLAGSVIPFHYNNIDELEEIVRNNDIGVIKMEVSRNEGPKDNYLQKVRNLATKNGIVLIFDECTSGFRETFGGIHKKYNVDPDLIMFGKAMGNGYGITAVVGRREIMESAQTTFISSTFWTERIGPTAAIKTLEIMERIQSWEIISKIGNSIRTEWQNLSKKTDIPINISGISALPTFTFEDNHLACKTYITQEMIKKGILATNTVYACIDHSEEHIKNYIEELEKVFLVIKDYDNGKEINKLLDGPISHSGFTRLN